LKRCPTRASSGFAEILDFLPVFFSFFVEGMTLGSSSFFINIQVFQVNKNADLC
jgi:hypothetical protein